MGSCPVHYLPDPNMPTLPATLASPACSIPYDLASLTDAAARCSVNIWTMRRWVKLGIIPVYRLVNGHLRVSIADCVQPRAAKLPPDKFLEQTDAGLRVRLEPRHSPKNRKCKPAPTDPIQPAESAE